MEALAAGTTVVAAPSGAIPSIVDDERTGLLAPDRDRMAEALTRVGSIVPAHCRATARKRFAADRMIRDYCALHDRLTSRTPGVIAPLLEQTPAEVRT